MRNPRQVQVLSALLLLLLSSLAGQAQHREVTNGNAVVPPLVTKINSGGHRIRPAGRTSHQGWPYRAIRFSTRRYS